MRFERVMRVAACLAAMATAFGVASCAKPDTNEPTFCGRAQDLNDELNENKPALAQTDFNNLVNTVAQINSPDKDTQKIKPDADTLSKSIYDPRYGGGPSNPPIVQARIRFTKFLDSKCGTKITGKIPDNGVIYQR